MSQEIVLKKIDNEFVGVIPGLGLMSRAASPEQVYRDLNDKAQFVKAEWEKAGLTHLIQHQDPYLKYVRLEKKVKLFIVFSLLAYFLGLGALALVIKNSAKRITSSLELTLKEPTPERMEKNLTKFKAVLQTYKPYIQEVQKVLDEKDSSKNR